MKWLHFICLLAFTGAILSQDDDELTTFTEWSQQFLKEFLSPLDRILRVKNWAENKKRISAHNQKFMRGEVSFKCGLWKRSDLSLSEKRKYLTGVRVPPEETRERRAASPQFPPGPRSIDWTAKGLVGPVGDQGMCSCCWAFSAAGVVEGVLRKQGITGSVSTQQLLDCSKNSCYGCSGGWPEYALEYVRDNGIDGDDDYAYYASQDTCTYVPDADDGSISAVFNIKTRGNETLLRDVVAAVGPVSIVFCISDDFYSYKSGVYYNPGCCTSQSHAMLITGYGTHPKFGDYWIAKNSWGTSWGESGFIRLARNRGNMCNLAYHAVVSTFQRSATQHYNRL